MAILVAVGGGPRFSRATASADDGLCPFRTAEEWQEFLVKHADNPKWVKTCEDSPCDADYYRFVQRGIHDVFERCAGFLARHPSLDRCTSHLRRFTGAWMLQHSAEGYGFTADNHSYLTRQEAPDKPAGMMKVPQAIVEALPFREKVEEAARKAGFKYLTHDSALENFRTFVLNSDPEGRFDQWLLLNLKASKGKKSSVDPSVKTNTPLSVLTVQKKDASGRMLPQVRLHFRDYTIVQTSHRYELKLFESNNGKCYSCHANGVRQLIARRTPVLEAKPVRGEPGFDEQGLHSPPDFAYGRLLEFNERLRSYGSPDWDGMVVPADHGPPLGKAQGCMDCHDGRSRGVLTVSTSVSQLEKKVYYHLAMPPDTELPRLLERNEMANPELSDAEAETLRKGLELHAELIRDYLSSRLPALRDWLLETRCR